MENEAAESFFTLYKDITSMPLEMRNFLCSDMLFVGGSPDRIITCDCCSKSYLEVKCPISINHFSPMDEEAKLLYLKKDINSELHINKNHQYFTQCQVQMAACKQFAAISVCGHLSAIS